MLAIAAVVVVLVIAGILIKVNSSKTWKDVTYEGCFFDTTGQAIEEQASIALNGTMEKEIPLFRKSSEYDGSMAIKGKCASESLGNVSLPLTKSNDGSVWMSTINYYTENEFQYVGVVCFDSLDPSVIMVGFSEEYCKANGLQKGTVLVVSSEENTSSEELWAKRQEFQVVYE